MRWRVACLNQTVRPLDRRNMAVLVKAFESFAGSFIEWDEISERSETDGVNLLEVWIAAARNADLSEQSIALIDSIADLADGRGKRLNAVENLLELLRLHDSHGDVMDDLNAWRRLSREIKGGQGIISLDRFLQELQLRPKERVPGSETVTLTTIHGAKGREFHTVYLLGLAEEVLPSWYSLKNGNGRSLEEERRSCFVAITRAKERLILSRARRYRGRPKGPSRFLLEIDPDGRQLRNATSDCRRQ